jgi:hypothetical protein
VQTALPCKRFQSQCYAFSRKKGPAISVRGCSACPCGGAHGVHAGEWQRCPPRNGTICHYPLAKGSDNTHTHVCCYRHAASTAIEFMRVTSNTDRRAVGRTGDLTLWGLGSHAGAHLPADVAPAALRHCPLCCTSCFVAPAALRHCPGLP